MRRQGSSRRPRAGTSHPRLICIRLEPWLHSQLTRLADSAGVPLEALASVWLMEKVNQSSVQRAVVAPEMETTSGRTLDRSSRPMVAGRTVEARNPRNRSLSLHDEIVSVLSANGSAMTVAEIAAAIRRRGHYRQPRTGHDVTPEVVSRRVSNPFYRPLFERDGRRLALATTDRDENRRLTGATSSHDNGSRGRLALGEGQVSDIQPKGSATPLKRS